MAKLIAITGGSCSGKTTLAHALARALRNAVVIAEDDYYVCSSAIPNFDAGAYNFDVPEAKDHALLRAHLAMARAGHPFDKPLYDFATHRRKAETEHIAPADFVIVEGMHLLVSAELRAMFDLAIFIDASTAIRRARRLARDIEGRQRTRASIEAQFDGHVEPMHELHVAPERQYAALVLDDVGEAGVRVALNRVAALGA
ncbi:MAG: uridine kinase [Pseudomonadota bacterium]